MVIFKCLSLKALSALQDLEGGGGWGNKNIYTNNIFPSALSHLLHTFSPSLSLSLSSTHTHTTQHTHIFTEQIRQI